MMKQDSKKLSFPRLPAALAVVVIGGLFLSGCASDDYSPPGYRSPNSYYGPSSSYYGGFGYRDPFYRPPFYGRPPIMMPPSRPMRPTPVPY